MTQAAFEHAWRGIVGNTRSTPITEMKALSVAEMERHIGYVLRTQCECCEALRLALRAGMWSVDWPARAPQDNDLGEVAL